jgi:hypothetical protein
MKTMPNALQRTRPSRRGCNPRLPQTRSLSLGRWSTITMRSFIFYFAVVVSVVAQTNKPDFANSQIKAFTPTNFFLQVLEPTGGKIQRPKDWFYTEFHGASSYTWVVSCEDASKGAYTTGVKIHTIVGVKKITGKTPKEFIEDYVRKQKKTADKVLKSCPESKQPLFTRICMETEEGPHHVLYSLFWGNDDLDLVVVSIAGTTKNLWDTYSPVFDKMSGFELLDMKRFDK